MTLGLNLLGATAILLPVSVGAQTAPSTTTAPAQQAAPDEPTTATTPQASPTAPATTPATTEQAASAQPKAATAADVKAGLSVYDQKGGVVGKIASISGKNAVLDTGTVKASIPISSFAKSDKGLVIGMTKAEIEAAAKKSGSKPG
jgi:myo-inositol-hexaphosphate 3-phosphohydrolase